MTAPSDSESALEFFGPAAEILNSLKGATVSRVSFEPWSVRLLLDGHGELSIIGPWILYQDNGVLDRSEPVESRAEFKLWKVAGRDVPDVTFQGGEDPTFTLQFGDLHLQVHSYNAASHFRLPR